MQVRPQGLVWIWKRARRGPVDTRRGFIAGLAVSGVIAGLNLVPPAKPGQAPQSPMAPQEKSNPPDTMPENPNAPSAEKHMLDQNEKDIKKKVDRLYELATELKAEVDKTDSTKVLSLTILKKTDEIEKLAKEIHGRAKG
jgi:hypothetical protein